MGLGLGVRFRVRVGVGVGVRVRVTDAPGKEISHAVIAFAWHNESDAFP